MRNGGAFKDLLKVLRKMQVNRLYPQNEDDFHQIFAQVQSVLEDEEAEEVELIEKIDARVKSLLEKKHHRSPEF